MDLIDRQAAIDALLGEVTCFGMFDDSDPGNIECVCRDKDVIAMLEHLPTIEAEPVKHGRWVWEEGVPLCSLCGRPTNDAHDAPIEFDGMKGYALVLPYYCGFCGAKMDEEEDIEGVEA